MNPPGRLLVSRSAVVIAALACVGAVVWMAANSPATPATTVEQAAVEAATASPIRQRVEAAVPFGPDPPGDSGLFDGPDSAGPARGEETAAEAEQSIGLRLVGVIGAGDSRIGLFAVEGAGGTRLGGVGMRFAERDVTVVGWREEQADAASAGRGAVAALLRRGRDGRVIALSLETAEAAKP
jgi:hypothetical protein